jgi:predicted RND superfamily exporter protein
MGYFATQVKLSYEFTRAIPTDNIKYLEYQKFREKFGDDGNTMVFGIESKDFFSINIFNAAADFHKNLKKISGVNNVLSIPESVTLLKDSVGEKLIAKKIFNAPYTSQESLNTDKELFLSLPFL